MFRFLFSLRLGMRYTFIIDGKIKIKSKNSKNTIGNCGPVVCIIIQLPWCDKQEQKQNENGQRKRNIDK